MLILSSIKSLCATKYNEDFLGTLLLLLILLSFIVFIFMLIILSKLEISLHSSIISL